MFIINIIGGLGNQMFCYAFSQAVKHYYQTEISLHIGGFEDTKDNNGFELSRIFRIEDPIISEFKTIKHLTNYSKDFSDKLYRKIFGLKKTHFTEKIHRFDPSVFQLPKNKTTFIEGLWQDENYFKEIEHNIRERFQFIRELDDTNKRIAEKIQETDSISLHVRRGDYISNPQYSSILGGLCNYDYYKKALAKAEDISPNPTLFIFSDDINWVKKEFDFLVGKNVIYINHNHGLDSYKDMQLMSYCKHNIIANSTFWWWGAWLNNNPDKKIFAPEIWFNDPKLANNHIVPDNWIKIDNSHSR